MIRIIDGALIFLIAVLGINFIVSYIETKKYQKECASNIVSSEPVKAYITSNKYQYQFPIGSVIEGREIPFGRDRYICMKYHGGIDIWVLSSDYKVINNESFCPYNTAKTMI